MRQEWSPPAPCEKCVKNGPPSPPPCVKSASRMVPPALGCVKNASRMVPPAPGVRKLQQDWSTSVSQFSRKPGLCENCSNTAPPVLLRKNCDKTGPPVLSQFSRKMDHCCCRHMGGPVLLHFSHVRKLQQHWGDQSCRSFRANQVVRKLQQDWSHQCCCNFRTCEKCNNTGPPMCENCNNNGPFCAKIATTLVQMREKCNNNGSICAKTVSTPVPHARKVQQHWGQNVRKVCQGLNTIGIYGLGFRV